MKNTIYSFKRITSIFFFSYIVSNCKSNSSSEKNNSDSAVSRVINSKSNANRLYSEGMKIVNDRISIQSSNKEKAMELNKEAIEKFSAAYNADTSLTGSVLLASECTMYAKDFNSCIYWTSILKRIDTSLSNIAFCIERIEYCNKQLKIPRRK
jgi:hypothetical protein